MNTDSESTHIRKLKSFYRAVEPQVETFQSGNMFRDTVFFKKLECTPLPYRLYYLDDF